MRYLSLMIKDWQIKVITCISARLISQKIIYRFVGEAYIPIKTNRIERFQFFFIISFHCNEK